VPERELIPLAQAIREFDISASTIYRHIAAGRLTAHTRAGGKLRTFVDRAELRKLLEPKPTRKRR
jgi:YD repeat-containing protein